MADDLVLLPPRASFLVILAHGAGSGKEHPFLAAVANALAERRIGTFRYDFPYRAAGRRRPDRADTLVDSVRAACTRVRAQFPDLRLVAGGKSMGGRMTSLALADRAEPRIEGCLFLGFPLHPARRPAVDRAAHLGRVPVPLLFLQGTRDALATPALLRPIIDGLGDRASLVEIPDADHGFAVPKRSGRTPDEVVEALADAVVAWVERLP